jgi:hypothetical protein
MQCDHVFENHFRDKGWKGYFVRYPILRDAIKRQIVSGSEIHHNTFDYALIDLCCYHEHASEAYRIMLDMIEGKVHTYRFEAAIRLSLIYQAYTVDPELQKLNRTVWRKLLELSDDKDESVVDGAAIAANEIAEEYLAVGDVPDEIQAVVDGRKRPRGFAKHAYRFLDILHKRVEAIRKTIRNLPADAKDADILAPPWDHFLGRKVLVWGHHLYRDERYGPSTEVTQRRVWAATREPLPTSFAIFSPVVLVGKLTKTYDLPVLRHKAGTPIYENLPVPEGYDLHEVRCRYVLEDARVWEVDLGYRHRFPGQ